MTSQTRGDVLRYPPGILDENFTLWGELGNVHWGVSDCVFKCRINLLVIWHSSIDKPVNRVPSSPFVGLTERRLTLR